MKKLTRIITVLLVLALLACTAPAVFAAEDSLWTSLTDFYIMNGDGTITSKHVYESVWDKTNFCLRNDYIAVGDYSVSVTMQGTMGLPNDRHIQEGLIPWYVDANNYVFAYVEWGTDGRPEDIRQMHISGKIGGQSLGWGDIWCDGIHVAQKTRLTLTVDKITEGADVKIVVTLKDGETVIKTDSRVLAGVAEAMSAAGKMGIYGYGDIITFSDFTSTAQKQDLQLPEENEKVLNPMGKWTSLTEHYVIEDNKITSTGAAETVWGGMNFCLSDDYIASGDYAISVDMKGTMGIPNSKYVQEGIIPWYVDENNYLFVIAQWADNDRPGELSQLHISGKIDGAELGYWDIWANGTIVAQNEDLTLKVEKITEGDNVRIKAALMKGDIVMKDGERVLEGKAQAMAQEGKMGVYAFNDAVIFSNFTSTAQKIEQEPVDPPVDPENPGTGDNLLAVVLTLMVSGAAVLVLNKKRR